MSTPSGGYYNADEVISIEVDFSEEVMVTGTPTFSLTVGRRTRTMVYDADDSDADTLRFNYSVVDGDVDHDGVSYGPNALKGQIVSATRPAGVDRTVAAIARDQDHRVDAEKPRVTTVRLTSNPGPDRVYGPREVVEVTVTFDERVTSSDAVLMLTVGTERHEMSLAGSGLRAALVFRYTVSANDEDTNGVSVEANALSGTVTDAAGNAAILDRLRMSSQSRHAVDGVPPSNPSLRIVSNPRGGGIYRQGETILVECRFDEDVGFSGGDEPSLTLRIGTADEDVARSAAYESERSSGNAVVFGYTVQDNDRDQDGISIAADAVTGGNTITDSAGNEWDGTHSALAEQRSHRVDGSLPTVRVTGVDVTSVGPHGIGEKIELEVSFSGPVYPATDDQGDELKFRLRVGNETEEMDFEDGTGSRMLSFEYKVMPSDRDEDGIGYAANALVGSGSLEDGHGWPVDRTVTARRRLLNQVVDGVRPGFRDVEERSSPHDGDTYARGESIEIAVRFDERVTVTHDRELKLELMIGTATSPRQGALVSGDGTDTLVFRYTVQDGDFGDSITGIDLTGGEVRDLAGNPHVPGGIDDLDDIKVDGVSPPSATVGVVSDAGDDYYVAGDRIEMEVEFSEVVRVSGRPVLLVTFVWDDAGKRHGPRTRRASLERTRPQVLVFAYTVQPGDIDRDGISIGPGALQGGRITDEAGNPVRRSLDVSGVDSTEHRVDAVEPSVAGIAVTSDPGPDGAYAAGDAIIVTVTFDEDMYVSSEAEPHLLIAVGAEIKRAAYADGSGTATLAFRYEVQVGDRDDDGISAGPNALMPADAVSDVAGAAPSRIPAMRRQSGHRVAADAVTVTSVRILPPPGPEGFRAGDRIEAHVIFGDRLVHVTGLPGEPSLLLSIGAHTRAASFAGGSGTTTLKFHYTVEPEDRDDDGLSVPADALQLGDATITDDAGNTVDTGSRAVPPDSRLTVNGSETGSDNATLEITSDPKPGTTYYGIGEVIEIEVRFDSVVHATGDPVLVLEIGGGTADAALATGSGTKTLTFRYRVQDGDSDDDGISVGPNALQEGTIVNALGVEVDRRFEPLEEDGDHKVDGVRPALRDEDIRIVSTPAADATYGAGEEIRIEVEFAEDVHVTSGEADLSIMLSIGQHLRAATFLRGSGTDTLTFRYVVQAGDFDDDGISIGRNALQGGTIEDAAGNEVVRTFEGRGADGDHKVDGVRPALRGEDIRIVSTPAADATYGAGEEIRIEVEFAEDVHVTSGEADLSIMLSIGQHLRAATFLRGSGTDTLTFRYVVQAGDFDDDGISIGRNALQGGTIEDAAGNEVVRTFEGRGADGDHKVDGVRPALRGEDIRIVSTPAADATYGAGEEIRIEVEFAEDVHVTSGEADLSIMLSIGQHLRAATFLSGSGTDRLTFRYLVQAGDSDEDGISIGPNALQGGTVEDAAGNAVVRTFSGLPADGRHRVKAVAAVVAAVEKVIFRSDAGSNDTYTTDDDILLDVMFNVPVHVRGDPPVLRLSIGSVERDAAFQEGSGTKILKFQYTVQLGDTDDDGISIGPNALSGTVEDEAGNVVDLTLPALTAQPSHKVSAELMLYPLSLTLLVGQAETINLTEQLKLLGVEYGGLFEATSDDSSVATANTDISGRMMTITSVTEGAATITAKAVDAAIYLFFGVSVETSPEETAVLEDALAAVGRGMIASVGSTIGRRLETAETEPTEVWGGLRLAPVSAAAPAQWSVLGGIGHPGGPFGHWGGTVGNGQWGVDDPYLERSSGYTLAEWLRGARFEMPFRGSGNPITALSVWGAGDWHTFEGAPESGLYDGSLASIYLGFDARGSGWISGAALSHAIADASYEFGGAVGGKGRLETELNVIHPYLQWAFHDRGKVWAIFGFGTGEATAEREGQEASRSSSDLSMMMGLGGMRYAFGPWAGFDFAVRGDAGIAQLETDEGPRAIEGLMVNVQRLRMGVEASLPMALGGIPVSPFIDIGGRYDGGDGATGGGLEMAGGFRYRGPMVGFEMKARALAMHTDESYSEEGVKATLIVGPDGRRGFRVLLSPRWGGTAESMDIFSYRGHPLAGSLHGGNRGWGLGTRISYGFDMRRRPGTIMPYWELDLSRDAYRQARLGVSYELASAFAGMPHRLELSSESTENDRHGSIMRFLLSGQAHF
ncbi:MAG: hypothetical protein OXI90_17640 [Gammaproteobacteria bacterium]|nr:hypothetical protein [Gammaproteobacteria bacterium]